MKKLLILSVLLLFVLPGTAQATTTLEDPDDVGPGMIDIKTASATVIYGSDTLMALTVEAYEPFDCATLLYNRERGKSLGFAIDYLSTDVTPDLRIRVRCLYPGPYLVWRARFVESRFTYASNTVIRPTPDSLMVTFTAEWFHDHGGDEPARWKILSARRIDFKPVEIDAAPDTGWSLFDPFW